MLDFLANPVVSADNVPNSQEFMPKLRVHETFSLEDVQNFLGIYGIFTIRANFALDVGQISCYFCGIHETFSLEGVKIS